jgi:hypothetical protein
MIAKIKTVEELVSEKLIAFLDSSDFVFINVIDNPGSNTQMSGWFGQLIIVYSIPGSKKWYGSSELCGGWTWPIEALKFDNYELD